MFMDLCVCMYKVDNLTKDHLKSLMMTTSTVLMMSPAIAFKSLMMVAELEKHLKPRQEKSLNNEVLI